MSIALVAISLEGEDTIDFQASRAEEVAWMVMRVDGAQCEIRMERTHVEALRDQLPRVLEGMKRAAGEEAACERAAVVGDRATDATVRALNKAREAEQAGAHDVATSLREAATATTETANAVGKALAAMDTATAEADLAADRLVYFMWQADDALTRPRDDDRPVATAAG